MFYDLGLGRFFAAMILVAMGFGALVYAIISFLWKHLSFTWL